MKMSLLIAIPIMVLVLLWLRVAPSYDTVRAQTSPQLQCEQLWLNSQVALKLAEEKDLGEDGLYAKSAAYGIAYQNCVARDK